MDALDTQFPPASSGPSELTLDAPVSTEESCVGAYCKVHLVEGTNSGTSTEIRDLLASRLRSAALVQFAGFAVFLLWHLFLLDSTNSLQCLLFVGHVTNTLILGLIGIWLTSRRNLSMPILRVVELVTFGLPVIFFALLQHERDMLVATKYDYSIGVSPVWMISIYTYALFIPNTWKRAAVVISMMSVVPLITAGVTAMIDRDARNLFSSDFHVIVEMVLTLVLAAAGATWGVHSINSLRDQFYEARQLGQYRLKRLIGSGGMGDVYLAEHQLMKRPCAIKVIRQEKAGDPKVLARFEREVQATAKLSHWNSIDIFDYGRAEDGTFYYVMEYLPGMNLSELVRRFGPMPASRVIHLIRQACDALQEAHMLGLLHRDLKPANIFSAVRGGFYDVSKLLDFGLAKPLTASDDSVLTQEGSITGSPLYMSPEQATGDYEPDVRSDIYSMGGVLYFLLTGRPPFDSDKPLKVLVAHAHETPPPLSSIRDDVPPDLEAVVMRCLLKSPDERFQTAAELAAALDDCQCAGDWTADTARRWWESNQQSVQGLELALN